MKILNFALTLILTIGASAALACGPKPSTEERQVLLKKVAGKPLSCSYNGVDSNGKIEIRALTRCGPNSPVAGTLIAFHAKQEVQSIREQADGTLRITTKSADLAIVCRLKDKK